MSDEHGERFLAKLVESDAQSLDVASDDEVERQMDAAGVKAERVPSVEELLARTEGRRQRKAVTGPPVSANREHVSRSRAPPPHPRARWSPVTVGTGIALAAVVVLVVVNRKAMFQSEAETAIQADQEKAAASAVVARAAAAASAKQAALAKSIRGQALAECGLQRYDECGSDLDQAKKLDPAGESEPEVVKAREAMKAARSAPEWKVAPK